jgi:hypothetical protein
MRVVAFFGLSMFIWLRGIAQHEQSLVALVPEAAACAMPPETLFQSWLKMPRKARFAKYRYAFGGVPDTSMDGNGLSYISFVYFSNSQNRAMLTFVWRLPGGRLVRGEDIYLMKKSDERWEASNGNGGPGTYEKVEQFVHELSKERAQLVNFRQPYLPESCISQAEWEEEQKGKH